MKTEHGLTPQQERFAQEVASGKSLSEAYRTAYPRSQKWKQTAVAESASRMATLPNVSARIAGLRAAAADRAMMTAADVLREAMRLARFDIRKLYREDGSLVPIHELDDETAAAVQAVEIQEVYEGSGPDRVFVGYTKKYKVADKNAALEKLFKHFGLYEVDNKQKTDPLVDLLSRLSGNVIGPMQGAIQHDDETDEA